MLFVTQLIYIKEGQEDVFDQFENIAIPVIKKHNGLLLLRIRPEENAVLENHIERPYEIHLVRFEDETAFTSFMKDEERNRFLHWKDQSIKSVLLIKGEEYK